jgi:hypothetical protein
MKVSKVVTIIIGIVVCIGLAGVLANLPIGFVGLIVLFFILND